MQTAARQRVSPALTVRELADRAGVSESLVRRGISDGSIPSFKLCGARRIPAEFLDELQRWRQP